MGGDCQLDGLTEDRLDSAVAGIGRLPGALPGGRARVGRTGTSGQPAAAPKTRAATTLNRFRSAYRSFCRWAFDTGRLAANPALRLRASRADSARTAAITPRETRRLLTTIRESGDPLRLRDEALFSTYALTGIRRCEALQLEARDFDSARATLLIRAGKGGRTRNVPLVRPLAALLARAAEETRRKGGAEHAKLFPGRCPGEALSARQAHARFERWKSAAALRPELSIHSFRAGFATALHRRSGDVVLVARALGHRDLRPMLRYIECDARRLTREIENSFACAM